VGCSFPLTLQKSKLNPFAFRTGGKEKKGEEKNPGLVLSLLFEGPFFRRGEEKRREKGLVTSKGKKRTTPYKDPITFTPAKEEKREGKEKEGEGKEKRGRRDPSDYYPRSSHKRQPGRGKRKGEREGRRMEGARPLNRFTTACLFQKKDGRAAPGAQCCRRRRGEEGKKGGKGGGVFVGVFTNPWAALRRTAVQGEGRKKKRGKEKRALASLVFCIFFLQVAPRKRNGHYRRGEGKERSNRPDFLPN